MSTNDGAYQWDRFLIFSLSQSVRGPLLANNAVSTQNIKWGSIFELCLNLGPFSKVQRLLGDHFHSCLWWLLAASHFCRLFTCCWLARIPCYYLVSHFKLPAKTFFGTLKRCTHAFFTFRFAKMIASRKPAGQCAAKLRATHSNGRFLMIQAIGRSRFALISVAKCII